MLKQEKDIFMTEKGWMKDYSSVTTQGKSILIKSTILDMRYKKGSKNFFRCERDSRIASFFDFFFKIFKLPQTCFLTF